MIERVRECVNIQWLAHTHRDAAVLGSGVRGEAERRGVDLSKAGRPSGSKYCVVSKCAQVARLSEVRDLPRLDALVRQVLRGQLEGDVRRLRQPMRAHLDHTGLQAGVSVGLQAGVDRVAGRRAGRADAGAPAGARSPSA